MKINKILIGIVIIAIIALWMQGDVTTTEDVKKEGVVCYTGSQSGCEDRVQSCEESSDCTITTSCIIKTEYLDKCEFYWNEQVGSPNPYRGDVYSDWCIGEWSYGEYYDDDDPWQQIVAEIYADCVSGAKTFTYPACVEDLDCSGSETCDNWECFAPIDCPTSRNNINSVGGTWVNNPSLTNKNVLITSMVEWATDC